MMQPPSSKYSILLQFCSLSSSHSHCIPLRHRALIKFGVIASSGGRHLSANYCKSRNCTDGIQVSRLHLLQLEKCCFALDLLWMARGSLNDVVDFISQVIVYHTYTHDPKSPGSPPIWWYCTPNRSQVQTMAHPVAQLEPLQGLHNTPNHSLPFHCILLFIAWYVFGSSDYGLIAY